MHVHQQRNVQHVQISIIQQTVVQVVLCVQAKDVLRVINRVELVQYVQVDII